MKSRLLGALAGAAYVRLPRSLYLKRRPVSDWLRMRQAIVRAD